MPITGTTKAKSVARLNVMRLGASRLDYYQPWFKVMIAGVDRTANIRISGGTITQNLDGQPDTASFRVAGVVPTKGQTIQVFMGDTDINHCLFGGHILSVKKVYESALANLAYDISCIDYTWRLRDKKILDKFTSQSATSIILALLATYAPWATGKHVLAGLPTIDEITFTNEAFPDALDRIAQLVGAYWYLDYFGDLHFFLSEDLTAHAVTDADDCTWQIANVDEDLSQTRTRAIVRGGGSNASTDVNPGGTSVPIVDGTWYSASGGYVEHGQQRLTYTGKSSPAADGLGTVVTGLPLFPSAPSGVVAAGVSGDVIGTAVYRLVYRTAGGDSETSTSSAGVTVSAVTAPGSAPAPAVATGGSAVSGNVPVGSYAYKVAYVTAKGTTLASAAGGSASIVNVTPIGAPTLTGTTGGSLTPGGIYLYGITFVTAAGETTFTSVGSSAILTAGQNAVSLTNIPISSDARVTARRIYRSNASGGDVRLVTTINDNVTTTATDTTADGSRSATPSPSVNTSGSGQVSLTGIPTSADGRVTARRLYRLAGGAYKFLATIPDNVTTTYTDNTSTTALGDLEPATDTSGGGVVTVTLPIGGATVTGRRLYRASATGFHLVDTINDNVTTTYSDSKADANLGDVPGTSTVRTEAGATGLPISDPTPFPVGGGWVRINGSILAEHVGVLVGPIYVLNLVQPLPSAIPVGATVVNEPFLSGIPASGAGAIRFRIGAGDAINIRVERDDATAQTALAALIGSGDGIVEEFLSDGRIGLTEAIARGDAELTLFKNPIITVSGTTRDQTVRPGRSIAFTLTAPSVSGTYKIQRVTLSDLAIGGAANYLFPVRTVDVSSVRFSFEDVVRQLQVRAAA